VNQLIPQHGFGIMKLLGEKRCQLVDTYWQTETGGIIASPLVGSIPTKPGSTTKPFFSIEPEILNEKGNILEGEATGYLVIKKPWPGIFRTIWGDHSRYEHTYFTNFIGYYLTGDLSKRDKDNYFWISGRIDDVMNVSGHRLGTAEIESAFVSHSSVVEASVVPVPHDLKGQAIYGYIVLKKEIKGTEELKDELKKQVRKVISPIATPDFILFVPELPKTRSGKIMRRILCKIAKKEDDSIGDITTLADPNIVKTIIELRDKNF